MPSNNLHEEYVKIAGAISGVIDIPTAGTAVQGTDIVTPNGVWIKALAGNSGLTYVGNDGAGDVASTNGFELTAGDVIHVTVQNLNELYFDAATNGDDICWIKA
jgi:hypothetical protein